MEKVEYQGFTIEIEPADKEGEFNYTVLNEFDEVLYMMESFAGEDHEKSGLLPDARSYIDQIVKHDSDESSITSENSKQPIA
ncbi:MAG TPA: hypothetical protein VEA58_02815 [Anaerovoracaceae bacterium]|nr:hypothetical protein [Anaerovoracaceae bacterium]